MSSFLDFSRRHLKQNEKTQRIISPRQAHNEANGKRSLNSNGVPDIPYRCEWYFERQDIVFGNIYIDGQRYTTFDEGAITIYHTDNTPVLRFSIDGFHNQYRTVKYIDFSTDLETEDIVRYYVYHKEIDLNYFNNWIEEQMYGGRYQGVAKQFLDLIEELDMFNKLLNAKIIKYSKKEYILNR